MILYGEEATKEAAREGEEAAAAFAQREKDIAEGKIPPPSPDEKPVKKKKHVPKPQKCEKSETKASEPEEKPKAEALPELKVADTSLAGGTYSSSTRRRKKRPSSQKEWSKLKTECAMMLSSGTKGTSKATILATRKDIADMSEKALLQNVSHSISSHLSSVSTTFLGTSRPRGNHEQCASSAKFVPPLLIGLQASDVAWAVDNFFETCNANARDAASYSLLCNEYGPTGINQSFCTFVHSQSCTIGRASKGLQNVFLPSEQSISTLGMPVSRIDCNVGGPDYSCSEAAAKILYRPTKHSNFQFVACNDDDIVTLNGQRISANGPLPVRDMDVCSVGARVFVFVEKITY